MRKNRLDRNSTELNEAMMRDKTKKQMQNLLQKVKGQDIGIRVRKEEKTKEDKLPNMMYMDNPFNSDRFIDTWDHFSKHDAHIRTATDKMNDSKRGKIQKFESFSDNSSPITENFEDAALSLIDDLESNTDKYNIDESQIDEFRNLLEDNDKEEFVKRYVAITHKSIPELPSGILATELLEDKKYDLDKIHKAEKWYGDLDYDERRKLQNEFGHEGVPSREMKFYEWLLKNKINEKKDNKVDKEESKDVLKLKDWIQTLDDDVIGTCCDKERPMFVNRPNRSDRPSYDVLRQGRFITFKGYTGQIVGIKNGELLLDVINDDNEHEIKKFDPAEVVKTLEQQVDENHVFEEEPLTMSDLYQIADEIIEGDYLPSYTDMESEGKDVLRLDFRGGNESVWLYTTRTAEGNIPGDLKDFLETKKGFGF